MFLTAPLAIALAAGADPTPLTLEPSKGALAISWADAEDRVQGSLSPEFPAAGQPMKVSVHVGSFEGAEFTGPVTMTLKPAGQLGGGESATIARQPGEKTWVMTFTPAEGGEHVLELSFRTTHLKVARGSVLVRDAGLPPWFSTVFGVALIGLALGLGLFVLFRKPPARDASTADPPKAP